MPFAITSPQNPKIKETARLDRREARDERRVTRVEGVREVSMALSAGVVPVEAFVCPDLVRAEESADLIARLEEMDRARSTRLYLVTPEVYARLAVREESGGVILVVRYLERRLDAIPSSANPFVCVVEGVEKPGNLGAILRSADGAGVDAVIVTEPRTDLHNPNVLRASLGAFFSVPVVDAPAPESLSYLKARGVQVVAAHPDSTRDYTDVDMRGPTALILGSEANGLSSLWQTASDCLVRIPMHGRVDSLNLAAAAALLLYEVVRQRGIFSRA